MKKTLSPDKEKSLFKLYIVYNYKYPNSDVDVTGQFFSIDSIEERTYGYSVHPDGEPLSFLGVNYFVKFLNKLDQEGKLKKAMVYVNRGTREQQIQLLTIDSRNKINVVPPAPAAAPAYQAQQFRKEPMSIGKLIS